MPSFDPTRAPLGRLTRLGVVLDGSSPLARLTALARMCERAGIDAIWLADPAGDTSTELDALAIAGHIATDLQRAHLGLMVDPEVRTSSALATAVAGLARATGVPIEVAVQGEDPSVADYAQLLRDELQAAMRVDRPRLSAIAVSVEGVRRLLEIVDDIVLPGWLHADLETAADAARAAAADSGRDPSSLGVAALVPVSIGRTGAEASARADLDPKFRQHGDPADIGIFGTLEECQDRVIALAHAGISDLRCLLPNAPDVHDVIAQLTAISVGTTEVLLPGALRSPAPPPPEGWGGRAPQPTRPSVSDGSRRR
jgi:alkanesulfonate monooxygenase SsuD/methylene tetrahydromethanopterin reductase-like flavin-dependent oxidoreductase (luciferase family)